MDIRRRWRGGARAYSNWPSKVTESLNVKATVSPTTTA